MKLHRHPGTSTIGGDYMVILAILFHSLATLDPLACVC